MNTPPSMSVVLSFFNEADNIPELVLRLRKALSPLVASNELSWFEMIFVNDVSTDNSVTLLQELAQGHDDIRILNMSRNFGVSPCVLAGMEHSSGDLVVYLDADLQDPPEVIPEMVRKQAETKCDVVHTVRRAREGETALKLFVTRVGYWILKYVATIPLQIEAGDFKLLTRRAVSHLVQLKEKRPYMRGLVSWIGFKQTQIYYNREPRFAGETKFPIFGNRVIANFFSSALPAFSDVPLQLASWTGGGIAFLSMLYALWIGLALLLQHPIPSWSIPLAVLSFISGVQLFCIGLLGLYIAAIHVESKGRPNYIIESSFGYPEEKAVNMAKKPDASR